MVNGCAVYAAVTNLTAAFLEDLFDDDGDDLDMVGA